jgi:hypothetical protein
MTIRPDTLGPCTRTTTPGSGPAFQLQGTVRPPTVTFVGLEAAGTKI